ncbi:MAG: peptidylprolyl isomerase [Holophagaceae bacterium]|nr:peptidylprolyl isomerase [Holophagaceae bacterium]
MKNYFFCPTAVILIALMATFVACDKNSEAKPDDAIGSTAISDIGAKKPLSNKLKIITSMGAFTLELLPEAAPKTVENFKKWAMEGFYEGIIFHRVIPDFMIQGGGHLPDMSRKPYKGTVTNEADLAMSKGLTNTRGTISMAYVPGDPFGASVQFFINVKNNPTLNFKAKNLTDYGHCPFGRVVQGMDVVDRISRVKTNTVNGFANVPVDSITIERIEEAGED